MCLDVHLKVCLKIKVRIFEVEHSGTSDHLVGQCGPAQSSESGLTAVFAVKMIGNDSPRQPLGSSSIQCTVACSMEYAEFSGVCNAHIIPAY